MKRLEKIVVEYINNDNRQTAMLINGKWGSGKTYFVKNTLIKREAIKEIKPVFISLNGLDSLDDVPDRILASLSSINPKTVNNAIDHVSSVPVVKELGAAFKFVQLTYNNLAKLYLPKRLKDAILFIDDLERVSSKVAIEDVLGYICTNYMEACNTKVVFICNEDEITANTKYPSIKEKTISITTDFEPSLSEIIGSFVKKEAYRDNSTMQGYFEKNKEKICSRFEDLEIINLRTVQSIIEVFHAVTMRLSMNSEEDVLTKVFRFIVAIQNEYDMGKLNHKDKETMRWLKQERMSIVEVYDLDKKPENKDSAEAYFKRFINKYYQSDSQEWYFFNSIFNYQLFRYLDENLLEEDIKQVCPKNDIETSIYKKYFLILQIEKQEEVATVIKDLIKYVKAMRYDTYQLRNIFYNNLFFKSLHALPELFFELEKDVIAAIINTIQGCETLDRLENVRSDIFDLSFDSVTANILSDTFQKTYEKVRLNLKTKKVNEFLEALENEIDGYQVARMALQTNHDLFTIMVDTGSCNGLTTLTNKANEKLRSILHSCIMSISNAGEYLEGEVPAIKEIIKVLEKSISEDNWKRAVQGLLIKRFKEAVDHIIATSPNIAQ